MVGWSEREGEEREGGGAEREARGAEREARGARQQAIAEWAEVGRVGFAGRG